MFPATPNKVTELGVRPIRLRNPAIGSIIHLNATRKKSVNVFFTLSLGIVDFSKTLFEKNPRFLQVLILIRYAANFTIKSKRNWIAGQV
jgi:hypothetical protein